jgi:hypothetical protein
VEEELFERNMTRRKQQLIELKDYVNACRSCRRILSGSSRVIYLLFMFVLIQLPFTIRFSLAYTIFTSRRVFNDLKTLSCHCSYVSRFFFAIRETRIDTKTFQGRIVLLEKWKLGYQLGMLRSYMSRGSLLPGFTSNCSVGI